MSKKKYDDTEQSKNNLSRRDFFKKSAVVGVSAAALTGLGTSLAQEQADDGGISWDYEYDVVVVGAGATGLPAAIRARDLGASVLVVEQNFDIGGKMIHSGARVSLGGGDAIQERDRLGESDPEGFVQAAPRVAPEALVDDPELLFKDMTDWSVVDGAGVATYRYNERELHRAWADNAAPTRQFLMDNYIRFRRIDSTHSGGGVSRARASRAILMLGDQTDIRAGTVSPEDAGGNERTSAFAPTIMPDSASTASEGAVYNGGALSRGLEFSAREKGVEFMVNRHMDELVREEPFSGRVLGIRASYTPRMDPDTGVRLEAYWQDGNIDDRTETINIRARKAVIIGSGGHSNNPEFRSMFYPAMRDPYFVSSGWALGGDGWQDASGIIAGMRIGANLAGMQQNYHHGSGIHISSRIATRDAYTAMFPGHPTFPFRRSAGISIGRSGFEHLIAVNQVGKRLFNEVYLPMGASSAVWPGGPGRGLPNEWDQHVPTDWRNTRLEVIKANYERHAGLDAALAMNDGSEAPDFFPGPVWAIFDQAAVERTGWNIEFPYTDESNGQFFAADTIEELAEKIEMGNEFQRMPLTHLRETVDAWNAAVDAGADEEFERGIDGVAMHKLETPRFYAASIMVIQHDSYGGLRINGKAQVVDMQGEVIPGLYAGGEASGGGQQHGLGRAIVHGYIAGKHAAEEEV